MQTIAIPQLQSIHKVVGVPSTADRAGSPGASVEETLVLPQLQFVEKTVVIPEVLACPWACRHVPAHRRVDELMAGFSGPCTQVQGGVVSTGTRSP